MSVFCHLPFASLHITNFSGSTDHTSNSSGSRGALTAGVKHKRVGEAVQGLLGGLQVACRQVKLPVQLHGTYGPCKGLEPA